MNSRMPEGFYFRVWRPSLDAKRSTFLINDKSLEELKKIGGKREGKLPIEDLVKDENTIFRIICWNKNPTGERKMFVVAWFALKRGDDVAKGSGLGGYIPDENGYTSYYIYDYHSWDQEDPKERMESRAMIRHIFYQAGLNMKFNRIYWIQKENEGGWAPPPRPKFKHEKYFSVEISRNDPGQVKVFTAVQIDPEEALAISKTPGGPEAPNLRDDDPNAMNMSEEPDDPDGTKWAAWIGEMPDPEKYYNPAGEGPS